MKIVRFAATNKVQLFPIYHDKVWLQNPHGGVRITFTTLAPNPQ